MAKTRCLLFFAVILVAIRASNAAWCVCRTDVSDTALQKTIDYACGAGADCMPILQNGACFQPNTVRSHCSWAANSYYQRRGQSGGTCDFSGTATLVNADPSYSSCSYPSSASTAGTSGPTPSSSTNTTGGFGPGTTIGLGPTGSNTLPDGSDGGLLFKPLTESLLAAATLSAIVLARGLL